MVEIECTHPLWAERILIMGPLAAGQKSLLMNHTAYGSFSLGTVIKQCAKRCLKDGLILVIYTFPRY